MTAPSAALVLEICKEEVFNVLEREITWKKTRHHKTKYPTYVVDSFESALGFLEPIFEKTPVEVLYAVGLNSNNRFLGCTKLASGTVDRAAVYPRLLVSFLLSTNSSAVLIAHNHPGGKSEWSLEDISLTKRLTEILKPLDIRLLDHILYVPGEADSSGQWMSMTKEGVI